MTNLHHSATPFSVQVDGQSPESWNNILAQFSDASIYQSWAYGAVRWGERNLSHLVLHQDGQVQAAAQLRIVRLPLLPGGIAYLRWGPLCHAHGQPPFSDVVMEMASRLCAEYVVRRKHALQVLPNAFPGTERAESFLAAFEKVNLSPMPELGRYRTVMIDLGPEASEVRQQMGRQCRKHLARSEKNDLALEVSDQPEAYRHFVRLYQGMKARKQFETAVSVDEFGRMQDSLIGSSRMHTFLAKKDGEAVGALVCSLMGNTAIYLLGATDGRARELEAGYFLHWQAMLWLKEHGARWYDLGGIDPETNPGGFQFKSCFGGVDSLQLPAHCLVENRASHLALWLQRWRRLNGLKGIRAVLPLPKKSAGTVTSATQPGS